MLHRISDCGALPGEAFFTLDLKDQEEGAGREVGAI